MSKLFELAVEYVKAELTFRVVEEARLQCGTALNQAVRDVVDVDEVGRVAVHVDGKLFLVEFDGCSLPSVHDDVLSLLGEDEVVAGEDL